MGEPKGKLVTPVADNPDDELRSLEVDALDNLKVAEQGTPTVIAKSHADEKLFGIESVVIDSNSGIAAGVSLSVSSSVVPDDKIWKITHIRAYNSTGDIATEFYIRIYHAGSKYFYRKAGTIAEDETINLDVDLYLNAGDYFKATFVGVASPETCYLNIFGYEMNAP